MLRKHLPSTRVTLALTILTFGAPVITSLQAEQTIYNYSLVNSQGKEVPLSDYKGKVVVIVNLASKSTFCSQLQALEKLQQAEKDKGLVVIGVPSNDFGHQEPGSDTEIQKYYTADEHVTFPVMAKSAVRGKDELPVYSFLTAGKKEGDKEEDVHWNFTKFIVGRDGKVAARFEPGIAPDDPDFRIAIEQILAGTFKKKPEKAETSAEESDREDPR